jgi:hypothetical protein
MDISHLQWAGIDQIGSCTAGLIRNRYSYDADHRLTQVDNTLFNPYEVRMPFLLPTPTILPEI